MRKKLSLRIISKSYASGTRRPPRAFLPIGRAFRQIRRQGISSFPSKNAFSERLLTKSNKESLKRVSISERIFFIAKVTFFRATKTLCSDCAFTISDMVKRFFPSNRKKMREENGRANFFDFGTWSAGEPDKVENYRFPENCSMDLDENQLHFSILFQLRISKARKSKFFLSAHVKSKKFANFRSRF